MEYIKLGDIVNIKTGKLNANEGVEGGKYPFFTCSSKTLEIDKYSYDCECVLVAGNGDLNVKYYNGKFDAYQRTYIIESKDKLKLDNQYMYYFLSKYIEKLRNNAIGGVIKYIKLNNLTDIIFPLPKLENQKKIVEVLDKAQYLIDKKREQIDLLDELVKSRFIEMFGNPVNNSKGWKTSFYEDICELITDGEHSTPKRSEFGIYLLSARNVHNHYLKLDDVDFIDNQEYERISKRIIPKENDILISCSGSVGRVCKVPKDMKFQMVRSVAILRLKNNINPTFMEWLVDSDYTQQQILKSVNQSSQANLFQGKIKKLKAIIPPMELQNEFVEFVTKTDSIRSKMEASLSELEDNFNSLMQKAFKGELF